MAQTSELPSEIINIPLIVLLKSSPCVWSMRSNEIWETTGNPRGLRLFHAPAASPPPKIEYSGGEIISMEQDLPERVFFDPWEVRKAFLAARTDDEILDFLKRTGRFDHAPGTQDGWGFDDFRKWQFVIKRLLQIHPSNWPKKVPPLVRDQRFLLLLNWSMAFPLKFQWRRNKPRGVVTTEDTLAAILATVYVDRLRGAKIRFCARHDCRKEFRVVSNHKREYCTAYCAHLASLRRLRKRRRKGM